jgi:hypothetical protein
MAYQARTGEKTRTFYHYFTGKQLSKLIKRESGLRRDRVWGMCRTHNWLLVVTRTRRYVSTGEGVTYWVIIQLGSIDSYSERGAGERITGGKT